MARARARLARLEFWLPALIVILDQWTKAIVRSALPLHDSVEIIPGFLNFTHIRNTGAAFGLLNSAEFQFKTVLISAVALAGLVAVALYSATLQRQQLLARIGMALVIGGAAGNLIDRVFDGGVVDFVDVYWRSHHFWAFNVADAAITIGVVTILLDLLGPGARVSTTA